MDKQSLHPFVSVLLPVYNGEPYLAAAIQCILDQTFNNFEVIIINDGSTDRSASIINTFQDPRIRFYQQQNQGLAATLNRAISLARGEYLARQDQDDVSLPQRFEKQVAFLDAHPHHGMVGTWAEIWNGNVKTGRQHRHPADSAVLKFELLFNNPFVHSSMMIKKSALDKAGVYSTDPSRQPPEDYELWSRVARAFEVGNIPEILTVYREVPKSISRMGPNPFLDKLLKLSAENIAYSAGRTADDKGCKALAALAHGEYCKLNDKPQFRELAEILYKAVDAFAAHAETRAQLASLARKRIRSLKLGYYIHRIIGSDRLEKFRSLFKESS